MPHVHNAPGQHDQTVSAIIIRTDGDEPRVLLHTHKSFDMLLQIGGHVELDETPWQAILHEILEEAGYEPAQLNLLQPHDRIRHLSHDVLHPLPFVVNTHQVRDDPVHFHSDLMFAFTTTKLPAHQLQPDESSDIRWLTRAELEQEHAPKLWDDTKIYCAYALETCLPSWEPVALSAFQS